MSNRKMSCLIVDDHPMARLSLRNMAGDMPELDLSGEAQTAEEAYQFLENTPVDLLLLDVEMPGGTGLELIGSLKTKPLVILITAKRDYAVEAYEHNVVDYLVKPINLQRFQAAVLKAHEIWSAKDVTLKGTDQSDFIFVRSNNALAKISFSDVLWIQALGDYVIFHTPQKKHIVHVTMRELELKLPARLFIRIHRSFIVAIAKIDSIEDGFFCKIGDQALSIGNQYKQALLQRLNLL